MSVLRGASGLVGGGGGAAALFAPQYTPVCTLGAVEEITLLWLASAFLAENLVLLYDEHTAGIFRC